MLAVDLLTCIRLAAMIAARMHGFSVKNALKVCHSPNTSTAFSPARRSNCTADSVSPVLRLYRGARYGTLGGGTSETLRDLIGKRIMDAADTGAELLAYYMTSGADLAPSHHSTD